MTPSQQAEAMAAKHGWDFGDLVADAPPPPADALELLRADGEFPLDRHSVNELEAS